MEKKDEILVMEANSPMDYATQFLKFGGNLENLEKMMELQERHEKNNARKAFHASMANFKKNPPEILKTKQVSYKTNAGQTEYKHADLGEIATAIGVALAEHGLSAIWVTDQATGIKVTCTITHELGYSIETSLSSPPDTSGGKNSIQAIGSTITYLQRYTLLALTGIAAADQDDDGKGSDLAGLSDDIKEEIAAITAVNDLPKYYKKNLKRSGESKKEFVALLADRKAEIVQELQNADS